MKQKSKLNNNKRLNWTARFQTGSKGISATILSTKKQKKLFFQCLN